MNTITGPDIVLARYVLCLAGYALIIPFSLSLLPPSVVISFS